MRFFFNLQSEGESIWDAEGAECESAASAWADAFAAVEEELGEDRASWKGWHLEISDAAGFTVAVIHL
jgi:hypothetical protein